MKHSVNRQGCKVTPEAAIEFTKTSVLLTYIWSPPSAKKVRFMLFRIFMYTSVFFSVIFILSLTMSIIKYFDNLLIVMKSMAVLCGVTNFVAKVIIVRIYCKEFEQIELTLKDFVKNANESERVILQKYVNKCWKFQFLVTCGSYVTTTLIMLGPLVLPQKFPTDAVYPFPVENKIVSCIVYLHQSIIGYHCSAAIILDCQMALFLWYLCARFESLGLEIKNVTNYQELCYIIRKHQSLLVYAEEVTRPIHAVVFSTVTITKFIMICGAFFLLSDEPIAGKIQFGIMVMSTTLNIYTSIWPADCLLDISSKLITNEIYDMCWTWTQQMRKLCLLLIRRTQQPVVIKIPGLLETLSNQYYSSFLSAAVSGFTALRVIVNS
nr:olfactory receptor 129 [Microplitis mediator]